MSDVIEIIKSLRLIGLAQLDAAANLLEQQADRIAELEIDSTFFKKQANTFEHMVLTCGVAARHPDPNLSRTGPYAGKWNSQQANEVRALRDDRDALRARLTSLESDSKVARLDAWLPIETAPKDGTNVLLIATRHSMLMPHPEMIVGSYRNGWWSGPSTLSHVTHWMPLPEAPAPNTDLGG